MIAMQSNDAGAISSPELPRAACDAIAPDNSKTIPAYAHSLSLRNPGTTIVTAPGILKIPRIARMYTGYPKPVITWVTNGPLTTPVRPRVRSIIPPKNVSSAMRDVVVQYNIALAFNSNPPLACEVDPACGVKPGGLWLLVDLEHTVQKANHVFPRQIIGEHCDRNAGREDGEGGARDFEAGQKRIAERKRSRVQRNQGAMQA